MSTFLDGYQLSEAQNCIQLASNAYADETSSDYSQIQQAIVAGLAAMTDPNWTLQWMGYDSTSENLAYVVSNNLIPNLYAVAFRGTDLAEDFQEGKYDQIIEDLDVYEYATNPVVTFPDSSIQISAGSNFALENILSLSSVVFTHSNTVRISLMDYLNSLAKNGMNVYITGHSLGGTLSTIFTSYLINSIQASGFANVNIKTYSFASLTVGNQAYADYYNSQTSNPSVGWQGYRIYNPEDIIPYWFGNLGGIADCNQAFGLGLIAELAIIFSVIDGILRGIGMKYVDVGTTEGADPSAVPLTNNLNSTSNCPNPANTLDDFSCWASFEHSHTTYETLLGLTTGS